MLKYIVGIDSYGVPSLKISMKGKSEINVSILDIYKKDTETFNLYKDINNYLATLPLEVQEAIYNLIREVDVFKEHSNYSTIENVRWLEERILNMVDLLNYENFKTWFFSVSSDIPIPDTITKEFIPDPDKGITKDKTYVEEEYIALIALVTFIRATSPIYLDYFQYVKKSTKHSLYSLLRLFYGTRVYSSPEIEKLTSYINITFESSNLSAKNDNLIILEGLSDDDVVDYIIAEVIFNKLMDIDVYTPNSKGEIKNIVSFVFFCIKTKGKFSSTAGNRLRAMSASTGGDREDHSYFGDHRKTTDLPIGRVTEIQYAISDPVKLAQGLGFTDFDFKLYQQELKHVQELIDNPTDYIQQYMLGWLIAPMVNPRSVFHIERRKVAELRIFAKVALLNTEQAYIGLFLASYQSTDIQAINPITRTTVNRAIFDTVKDRYKWVVREDKASEIEEIIPEVSKVISNYAWVPVGNMGTAGSLLTAEGLLDVPNNINDIVTKYVAYVTDRLSELR